MKFNNNNNNLRLKYSHIAMCEDVWLLKAVNMAVSEPIFPSSSLQLKTEWVCMQVYAMLQSCPFKCPSCR